MEERQTETKTTERKRVETKRPKNKKESGELHRDLRTTSNLCRSSLRWLGVVRPRPSPSK